MQVEELEKRLEEERAQNAVIQAALEEERAKSASAEQELAALKESHSVSFQNQAVDSLFSLLVTSLVVSGRMVRWLQ